MLKIAMDQKIMDFLTQNKVAALSVVLADGTLHSSAMHYSQEFDPFVLYFSTDSECRKFDGLKAGTGVQASVVIGLSEQEWVTMQISGKLEQAKEAVEIRKIKDVHYTKIPGSKKFEGEPTTVYLKFTPTWWRYTDFNTDPVTYTYMQSGEPATSN